jgi:uncharacterized protein
VRLSTAVVKSTRLRSVERLTLTERGAVDDRRFFLIDSDGTLQTARRIGALLTVQAVIDPTSGELVLSFDDGSEVRGAIQRGPLVGASFGGDPVAATSVLGPFDEALTRQLGKPVRLVEAAEPGTVQDAEPLTLISTASIQELARIGETGSEIDPRRFRMNVELEGCRPFEEDGWRGRRFAVGTAVLQIGSRTGRCVVTTLDPDSGRKSLDTLKLIARRALPRDEGLPLGVYAHVVQPGVVSVGDEAHLVDDAGQRAHLT